MRSRAIFDNYQKIKRIEEIEHLKWRKQRYGDDPTPGSKDVPYDHLKQYSGQRIQIYCESEVATIKGEAEWMIANDGIYIRSNSLQIFVNQNHIERITWEDNSYVFQLSNGKKSYIKVIG